MTRSGNTDTRCRSPINGLAGLHRRPPAQPPLLECRAATGRSVRGRSKSLGQKIASRVARRSSAFPAGQPDGRRSAAFREPIDHRLDSASFMSSQCAVQRVDSKARWYCSSSGHSLAVRTAGMTNEHRWRPLTRSQTRLSSTADNNNRYLSTVVPVAGYWPLDLCRGVSRQIHEIQCWRCVGSTRDGFSAETYNTNRMSRRDKMMTRKSDSCRSHQKLVNVTKF